MIKKVLLIFLIVFCFITKPVKVSASAFAQSIISKFDSLNLLIPSTSLPVVPAQTPTPVPKKSSYIIAIIGDSMVDTMGERLEYLEHALKRNYPRTTFSLYNYGQGAQNIEEGLARFNSEFTYATRKFVSIPTLHPDILIIGSFGYNPFAPHDRNKHRLILTQLVNKAHVITPDVYMLAEIAPLRSQFGRGPNGVNWSDALSYEQSAKIIELLENAVNLSRNLRTPLIDAYDKTFDTATKTGIKRYVNPSDGIHPSVVGHEFTAELIAETLKL